MILKTNTKYNISGFIKQCPKSYMKKLLAMGFLPNTSIFISRKSLMGALYQIKVKQTSVAMRNNDLDYLILHEQQ